MHLHVKGLGKNMGRTSPLISCYSETPSIHSKGEMMRARAREGSRGRGRSGGRLRSWRGETRKMDEQDVGLELLQSTLAKLVLKN